MLILWKTLKRTIVRSVEPLSPLLWFVSATGQEKQLCLHQCSSKLGINLKLILLRTISKSGKRSLVIWSSFKRLYFDVLAIFNVSNLKTRECKTQEQQFTSAKTLLKLFCIKSSRIISYQSSYLRNSRVLRVCIWFALCAPDFRVSIH